MEDGPIQEPPLEGLEIEPEPGPVGDLLPTETGPTSVNVTNWPAVITEQQYELVTLPSGVHVRVDRHVTYGELLVASMLSLVLVVQLGRWLWERIRGVL